MSNESNSKTFYLTTDPSKATSSLTLLSQFLDSEGWVVFSRLSKSKTTMSEIGSDLDVQVTNLVVKTVDYDLEEVRYFVNNDEVTKQHFANVKHSLTFAKLLNTEYISTIVYKSPGSASTVCVKAGTRGVAVSVVNSDKTLLNKLAEFLVVSGSNSILTVSENGWNEYVQDDGDDDDFDGEEYYV